MAFLGVVVGLLVMQDALGIGLAWALGQERLLGLLGASVTLSGGHGTGAAWAKVFAERHGLASATEIAMMQRYWRQGIAASALGQHRPR
jgi:ESS family glutamate:Na+ symporter